MKENSRTGLSKEKLILFVIPVTALGFPPLALVFL